MKLNFLLSLFDFCSSFVSHCSVLVVTIMNFSSCSEERQFFGRIVLQKNTYRRIRVTKIRKVVHYFFKGRTTVWNRLGSLNKLKMGSPISPTVDHGHSDSPTKSLMDNLLGLLRIRVKRGINLAVRDVRSSDPYVVVRMGQQVLCSYLFMGISLGFLLP